MTFPWLMNQAAFVVAFKLDQAGLEPALSDLPRLLWHAAI